MWKDILISLAMSISEAIFVDKIEKNKAKKIEGKLNEYILKEFNEFSDTSLDCDDFARVIKSRSFVEMLRNYFFAINENIKKSEYLNRFETYICNECSKVNLIDVRRYVKKIEKAYLSFLHMKIEENATINAFFHATRLSHKEIVEHILESEENLLKYMKHLDKPNIKITNNDILEYHRVCQCDYGTVRFTGISGVENKQSQDINQFYVENKFSFLEREQLHEYRNIVFENEQTKYVELKDFFDYNNKIVLIGAAGLGKSTTLNYLFCNYEKIYNQNAIKLKVDLKDYAKAITEEKHTILWCLSTEFSRRIPKSKLNHEDVENLLDEYLRSGECLVIFDALDEISTQSMRTSIRDEISTFCNVYYLNKFIISSREVGYLRNQFDKSFIHIRINEFNDKQIKKYGYNWIKINYNNIDVDEFWIKFDKEAERAKCKGLIRNPIVLILALVIFDIEKNLPNKRVEFYKKCIDTFLVVREDRKSVFPQDDNFKNILGDNLIVPRIAHYKFIKIESDMNYKFTNDELENAIMEAIEVRDKRNWFAATRLFAKYLVDRTELVREVDDDVLDFSHKTFYEYFLATYFAKELEVDDIIGLLSEWIGDSNYDELARLIIEIIIEKNDVKQHKRIIEYLFEEINNSYYTKKRGKAINVFSIVAELFSNNMIQAKYQHYYYECLVLNSRLTYDIISRKRRTGWRIDVNYNPIIAAETYKRLLEENEENFYKMIECFYCLSDAFKNEICKIYKSDIRFTKLSSLFESNRNIKSKSKKTIDRLDTKNYFLYQGKDMLVNSPEVYLCVLSLMISLNNYEGINQMINVDFDKTNKFGSYIYPTDLYELIYNCFNSSENYIIVLISLIMCGYKNTNFYLKFVLENVDDAALRNDELKKGKAKQVYNNTIDLYNWLNGNIGFEAFLQEKNIFDKRYCNIYHKLFEQYQTNERNLNEMDIMKYQKK